MTTNPLNTKPVSEHTHLLLRVRGNLIGLVLGAGVIGLLVISVLAPLVLNLSPTMTRSIRYVYLGFTPLLLVGLGVGLYIYLRPVAHLADYLARGADVPVALARRARILAFSTPIYVLVVPILATLCFSALVVLFGFLLVEDYDFARRFPSAILVTIVAAGIALLVSARSRRILAPVLLVTADVVKGDEDIGPRFDIRTRQVVTSGILTLICIAFLAVLGYTMVYQSALEGLRERHMLLGDLIARDFAPYLSEDALVAYVQTLSMRERIFASIVDAQGRYLVPVPSTYLDLVLPSVDLRAYLESSGAKPAPLEVQNGEILLIPLPETKHWLVFAYRAAPLQFPSVQHTVVVLVSFVAGMSLFVLVSSQYLSADLAHDIQYVTRRIKALATATDDTEVAPAYIDPDAGVALVTQQIPALSLDEVGDLVRAFNTLVRHNAKLYAALSAQRQAASALVRMAQVINSTLELNQVLDLALESLGDLVSSAVAAIWLSEGEGMELAAQRGGVTLNNPDMAALGEEILHTQQVRVVYDIQTSLGKDVDLPRSWIAAPLVIQGRAIGLLAVGAWEPGAYVLQDSQQVTAFAEHVATAVQNARLYQTMLARAQELALLHEVSQQITRLLDVPVLLTEIAERVAEVFDYQVVSIHLLDAESGALHFAAQWGVDEALLVEYESVAMSEGVVGWVAQHGEPRLVSDVTEDDLYIPMAQGIRSELALPLMVGDRMIGVFNLESQYVGAFDADDARLMTALSHQIAVVLENARLFESVQTQARELAQMAGTLAEEKHKLDAILRNIADGLLVTDPQERVSLINPAFETLFDCRPADIMGHSLVSLPRVRMLQTLISKAVADPSSTFSAEISLGERRVFKATTTAIKEANNGRVLGTVSVVRDISQEKEVEQMKNEFIATVSHELRTPLTSVLGFAKLIARVFEKDVLPNVTVDDRRTARAIRRIEKNLEIVILEGDRLTRLINDVLDISKLESGKIEWEDTTIDLATCIEEAVLMYRALADAKDLTLTTQFDAEDLPSLIADPVRIRQVIGNLLSNAVKFTGVGEIKVAARELASGEAAHGWRATPSQKGGVLVTVSDTGPGIAPEDIPRLFHRFQQLVSDTLTDKPKGTGLGLAICKEIVSHYGGEIWAESVLNEGTTFYFTLPLHPQVREALPEGPSVEAATRPSTLDDTALPFIEGDNAGASLAPILVVEDDEYFRSWVVQEIESAGYRVLEADNGTQALGLARQYCPAAIVLDIMLPDLSGFDVTRVLKSDTITSEIPLLILSGLEEREQGLSLGAEAYLTKPVDADVLLATLETVVSRNRKHALGTGRDVVKIVSQVLQRHGFDVVVETSASAMPEDIAEREDTMQVCHLRDGEGKQTVVIWAEESEKIAHLLKEEGLWHQRD